MSIVAMKRLGLIALRSDREELLKRLQDLGCVAVDETRAPDEDDPLWVSLTHPPGEALAADRERLESGKETLDLLKRSGQAPKQGLLSARPQVSREELFDDGAYARAGEMVEQIRRDRQELARLNGETAKLKTRRQALAPWLELDVPLDQKSTSHVTVLFGGVPLTADLTSLEGELGELCWVKRAGKDRDFQYILLLCHKSVESESMDTLTRYGFSRVTLRDVTGTAAENDRALAGQIAENEKKAGEMQARIDGCAARIGDLELYVDRAAQEVNREEAKSRVMDTDQTFYLSGWFPAADEERVKALLKDFPCASEIADPTEEEIPQVPVKLKNGIFSRCMNVITDMYSLPAYDGIDPNPLMAPFFILFFGMMMADMGYGILMIAAALVVLKKTKPREGTRNFMELVLWCGVSTLIWGAMTGGFFGDFIPQLLKIINPESTFEMPALFTPLKDTVAIMLGSLVLGLIQEITGMTVSVVKKIKDGNFIDALFDEITWWIILVGVALLALGKGSVGGVPVVLVVGFLMLAIGGTREAKGFGKVTSLIGLVYNGVSGFFSDTLSYVRLMALMLSGSVIASVFNTLGATFGNVVVFVIISMIGNALNLALNLLGCYVHDLRLQCLEFFNRFYKEGGRRYEPLSLQTKYVDIKEEL